MMSFPRCDCGAVLSFTPIVRQCDKCHCREKVMDAAKRLMADHYYGDGGNLMDAIRERRQDGKLVAAELLTRMDNERGQ